ncbi:hypothetical protein BGW80DRAFT_1461399 [Lactifluus volemus]|nr:hypothetical protein BGW80DRAFT_1461399 [Lactifluus volemus]
MQAFVNPFASDAIQRVPLTYENMSMLERECDVPPEEYEALLIFCAGAPIPDPHEFAYTTTIEQLLNVHTALCELFERKESEISALEEDVVISTLDLEEALARDPELPKDDEARFLYKMCNSGERRLLHRTWSEQCDLVLRILGAFMDEGFEIS